MCEDWQSPHQPSPALQLHPYLYHLTWGSREPSLCFFLLAGAVSRSAASRPPRPVLSVSRAQWPCASCAFTRPNVSTAVIQPAGLQDSGAMFLLLVLLTGLDGPHAGHSKFRYFPPPNPGSWGDLVRIGGCTFWYRCRPRPYPGHLLSSPIFSLSFACPWVCDQEDRQPPDRIFSCLWNDFLVCKMDKNEICGLFHIQNSAILEILALP